MPVSLLARAASWTFDEVADLPRDGNRYEVVDGNLVVTPPPTDLHAFVARRLQRAIDKTLPEGWDSFVDCAVRMGTDGRIPDLALVRLDEVPTSRKRNTFALRHFGLVCEVESPRTRKTDRFAKPGEYAEAGIPIYWRVELDDVPLLRAYVLRGSAYVEVDGPAPLPWGTLDATLSELGIS